MIIETMNKNKKVCMGEIINGTFIKRVTRKKHYFKIGKGYNVQKREYDEIIEPKIKDILIIVEDTKERLRITKEMFREHCWIPPITSHGEQYAIAQKYFTVEGEKNDTKVDAEEFKPEEVKETRKENSQKTIWADTSG